MPITVDALILGLTAGAISYDPKALEMADWPGNSVYGSLSVQVYGTGVISGQKLQDAPTTNAVFTAPADATSGNFKVKSYLNAPVVCPISTSGTASKIAFALNYSDHAAKDLAPGATETVGYAYGAGNQQAIRASGSTVDIMRFGDIFMVITMSPGIVVTAGGYLTVKGYSAGVSGSDSFTYITLESGAE